jgi:cation diffusion facilitator CzcD-associated flavoprotein CzcO
LTRPIVAEDDVGVPERLDLAVTGAGPFGMSVAAHLPQSP